jgi:hypothetical protein
MLGGVDETAVKLDFDALGPRHYKESLGVSTISLSQISSPSLTPEPVHTCTESSNLLQVPETPESKIGGFVPCSPPDYKENRSPRSTTKLRKRVTISPILKENIPASKTKAQLKTQTSDGERKPLKSRNGRVPKQKVANDKATTGILKFFQPISKSV